MPHALITGGSRGFGAALVAALADRGWTVTTDARDAAALHAATAGHRGVTAVPGDVTDPDHRGDLLTVVGPRLDLLVLNASALGPSPLSLLYRYPLDELRLVHDTNVVAPLSLTRL